MDCPFCNIISKDTERKLYESEHVFAVLSNPRLVPGHILVIPKRHVEKFGDLSKEERSELLDEAIKIEENILKHFSGCDLSQHFRPFLPQSQLKVNHLHIHLRPREFEDELYKKVQIHEKEVFTKLEQDEFEKYKKLFFE